MTKLRNRNKTKRRHHVSKRHRHRTRSQKGGDLMHTLSFGFVGTPDQPVGTGTSSWTNWFTGPSEPENYAITNTIKDNINILDAKIGDAATTTKNVIMDEASELTEKAKSLVSGEEEEKLYSSPLPTPPPSPPLLVTTGGKSRKHKNKKGGANLGLLYYATPVKPVVIVEKMAPMSGGKSRKHTGCKNKGKRHRHNASCLRK